MDRHLHQRNSMLCQSMSSTNPPAQVTTTNNRLHQEYEEQLQNLCAQEERMKTPEIEFLEMLDSKVNSEPWTINALPAQ